MYVKNWPDTRFHKYEKQIDALGPLNDAQKTYHLDTPDDDPTLTEKDIIPMCEMLEVKVDLRRSNILYTAERDWAKPLAEAKGMEYDKMSKEELVEMNEEIRRVLTTYEHGMDTYNRKVDMNKHYKKLDDYNSRAIAYYLEHRRCQRMVAGIAKLGDTNNGSTSDSEAMDQVYEDDDSEDSTAGNESSDDDGKLNDDLEETFETVIASGRQQSEKQNQENAIHDLSFENNSEENQFDDDHEGLVIDVDDNSVDANKENFSTNTGSLGADRFIELASLSPIISTKDATSTQTNSETTSIFGNEPDVEVIAGFNDAVDSEDIQLYNADGIVKRYERTGDRQ